MPSPEMTGEHWPSIRSGPLEARFLPENGGRMTHLVHDRLGDILVPTAGPEFEPLNWPKAGAYPLFPYHNKLLGAAFMHDGKRHAVLPHPALRTDAQHGPAHRRAWQVASLGTDRIELVLDYRADPDWPFDFRAVQRLVLGNDRLDIELSMTNTGQASMPGGLGWHPYFAADLGRPESCDAGKIWPPGDAGVPDGIRSEARSAKILPNEAHTLFLSDWQRATVATNGGIEATLTAGPELKHLVAHRTADYVCLEPVSHVAGAFGFPRGSDSGLFVLRAGEQRSASLAFSFRGL